MKEHRFGITYQINGTYLYNMTNREKIENWVEANEELITFDYISQIEDNLFLYDLFFVESAGKRDGAYDISVNDDDTISYLEHLRI